ncbi:MAG TPA: winged helix-turn-helix domain-containing protein [Terriglobales bacterium]|nr:winged helix-turn-helix domain-containing protein [Terriglobales bacterium]
MGIPAESEPCVRFGEFKLDLRTRELRSNGHRSYLQEQPFQILALLLDRPGQLVSRDELMKKLWPSDTFVDFDHSINKAVNRLREALDDSVDQPRFIETVPRRGYRFVGPVAPSPGPAGEDPRLLVEKQHALKWQLLVPATVLLVMGLVGGGLYWRSRSAHRLAGKETIVLADFVNNTTDPVLEDALQQALLASLNQSPFLTILSDDKVREQLGYMGRPATDRLTEPVAREVCQRAGSMVVLVGSISSLGTHYALGLNAVNCQTGESISRQVADVESREKILQAIDRISTETRETLGESLGSIQKYNVRLEQATTSSLEALRSYRIGLQTDLTQGSAAAIPFFKQAIALDQNFSEACAALGVSYFNLGQADLGVRYLKRAMALSSRINAHEKLDVSASYYSAATRELDKAIEVLQLWEKTYPGDPDAPIDLSYTYWIVGQYEQCAAASRRALGIDASASVAYSNLAGCLVSLDRLDAARKVVDDAFSRKLDDFFARQPLYSLAFLQGDEPEMQKQLAWAAGRPGQEEGMFLGYQADTEAFHGRLNKSHEYSRRAVDSELRADSKEGAATNQAYAALWQAEFGNLVQARKDAARALALSPGRDGKLVIAMALARIGDFSRAKAVANDVLKAYPLDTLLQFYSLPSIQAAVELSRGDAAKAEDFTERARPYELGTPTDLRPLYPSYVRGQAYLAMHRGNEAAVEFQRILDHRGLNANSPLGALAHLQIGRAYALSGDPAKARTAYQDFLVLWKDADPDIPILKQAKAEYAKLR